VFAKYFAALLTTTFPAVAVAADFFKRAENLYSS
jgi:hypothetical protein